ncbi:hypothetical protein [Candidatus Electronema sp. TJ]|uniref:hypothetical protein n=1 Tax=Candidatus Electronema sp. TJ TaxID=3401573 RepID=UPI003AA8A6B1
MGMLSLKRQKWTGLLPVILLWLLPGNAAAQNSPQPVSNEEGKCVVSVTKDALQNNQQVRQQLDQTLSQVRAQSCQSGEQMAMEQFVMMMYSVLASMTQHEVLMKCFPMLLQQQQNAQTHEKLNMVMQVTQQIMAQTLAQSVPRPLCR